MKIRLGFVSNSSSASFVIPLTALTGEQLYLIVNYKNEAARFGFDASTTTFDIKVREDSLVGDTSMDNMGIDEYLEKIGVKAEVELR